MSEVVNNVILHSSTKGVLLNFSNLNLATIGTVQLSNPNIKSQNIKYQSKDVLNKNRGSRCRERSFVVPSLQAGSYFLSVLFADDFAFRKRLMWRGEGDFKWQKKGFSDMFGSVDTSGEEWRQ